MSDKLVLKLSILAGVMVSASMVGTIAAVLGVVVSAIICTCIAVNAYILRVKAAKAEIEKNEVSGKFQAISNAWGFLCYNDGDIKLYTKDSAEPSAASATGKPATTQPAIPAIRDSLSLVLLGSQGTGKTTLLCHLIDARANDGETIIIDPHGYSGKYGNRPIVGAGRAYGDIDQCLIDLLDELNRRYTMYQGQSFPKLWIYVDETTLLKKNCGAFSSFMEVALTEFRKVGMRLTLCLHSRRAKFLGLHGAMDLAEGIDWLTLKNENGNRWGELETDSGNIQLSLPGPYHGSKTGGLNQGGEPKNTHFSPSDSPLDPFDNLDPLDPIPLGYDPNAGHYAQYEPGKKRFYESKKDKTIIEMIENGESFNAICNKIWKGNSNGNRNKIIKAVMKRYGIRGHGR